MTENQGVYDSTDPDAISAAGRDAAARERADDETIRIWMNHPKGRDLLYRIVFDVCHMGRLFTAIDEQGRSDTHRTYLDLGERNIGAWFDDRMRRHAAAYTLMLEEQEIGRQTRNAVLTKQNQKQGGVEQD